MNTKKLTHLTSIVAGSLLLFGCEETESTSSPSPPPEVLVSAISSGKGVYKQELSGRTVASAIAEVRPRVSGIILEKSFMEGGAVDSGQTLYRIEDEFYHAERNRAAADVESRKAQLNAAQRLVDRYESLLQRKSISQNEYDGSIDERDIAIANLAASQAELDLANINLSHTYITAPISGKVGISNFTQGAYVTADQTDPLVKIQKLDPIYVDFTQPVEQYANVKNYLRDNDISVTLIKPDGSSYPLPGFLSSSDISVDPDSGSVTLRAKFPNPDGEILPNVFVRVKVDQFDLSQGILIPTTAVQRDLNGNEYIYAINDKNIVEKKFITTNVYLDDFVWTESDINENLMVITKGFQAINEGEEVSTSLANDDVVEDGISVNGPLSQQPSLEG